VETNSSCWHKMFYCYRVDWRNPWKIYKKKCEKN